MATARLELSRFRSGDPLTSLPASDQRDFLVEYLADLGAVTVLKEKHYFDRDYLEEFSAFYSTSSRGYPNICSRLHFFARSVDRRLLGAAAGGSQRARATLQESYLGFIVLRPIPAAPFGRTVMKWYEDPTPSIPRVVEPSRRYTCHVAGIQLTVTGLAWQQQDSGVGACATIALWTMLHSIAFDDYHAIPTTSDITRFAHRTASLGQRVFPSQGLTLSQICEAIKESALAPVVCEGDIRSPNGATAGFTRARFASYCASLVRSGYPVLLGGELDGTEGHAICCVGFRDTSPPVPRPNQTELQDQQIRYIYVHDDNLGPNVRFEVLGGGPGVPVRLKPSAPQHRYPGKSRVSDPTAKYPLFRPDFIVAAVHNGLRTSPDEVHDFALEVGHRLRYELNASRRGKKPFGLTVSAKFRKAADYVGQELDRTLNGRVAILRRTRLALWEEAPPMSLHVGIIRIGWGPVPLLDVLYDTSDTGRNARSFCHVVFDPSIAPFVRNTGWDLGIEIPAY